MTPEIELGQTSENQPTLFPGEEIALSALYVLSDPSPFIIPRPKDSVAINLGPRRKAYRALIRPK